MAQRCALCGKGPQFGQNIRHVHSGSWALRAPRTKRRWLPNLHERRFWVPSENRWIKLRVSSAALRTIDKNGIETVLAELRARGEKV